MFDPTQAPTDGAGTIPPPPWKQQPQPYPTQIPPPPWAQQPQSQVAMSIPAPQPQSSGFRGSLRRAITGSDTAPNTALDAVYQPLREAAVNVTGKAADVGQFFATHFARPCARGLGLDNSACSGGRTGFSAYQQWQQNIEQQLPEAPTATMQTHNAADVAKQKFVQGIGHMGGAASSTSASRL